MNAEELKQRLLPGFRIAPMDDLDLFLISETELEIFEVGTSESSLLTLGASLVSAGASFGVSLLTTQQQSKPVSVFLWVATLVGLLTGVVVLLLWRSRRKQTTSLAQRIRSRKPPSGQPEQIVEGADVAIQAPAKPPVGR